MEKSKYEDVFSKFSYGVYVISSNFNDKINGCTIAWVTRVSFLPPLVAVSVAPGRLTHQYIKNSRNFALSVLPDGERGIDLGRKFGLVSGRKVDKFANIDHFSDLTGAPIIKESIAYADCNVIYSSEAGDHTIFVGEIVSGKVIDGSCKPLNFITSDYFGR